MRNNLHLSVTVTIFIIFALVLFILGKSPFVKNIVSMLSVITTPLERVIVNTARFPLGLFNDSEKLKLKQENQTLFKRLVSQKTLESENNALRDQFNTSTSSSIKLLPADVLGMPSFLPGISIPEYLILDKGERAGIHVGQAVIVNGMVVGKVVETSAFISKVSIVTDLSSSLAAKTLETQALGVIKGGRDDLIFDNVLLSEKLKLKDIILTKGDIDSNGRGYPPDLIIGKIVAIDKKPSNLFQTARVKSLLDLSKLSTVFIVIGFK